MHNEEIYQRIAKVENTESLITSDNRKHIKHVENELKLMKNLKEKGRVRNILKIQRENEDLLQRIERARPEYTRKAIKEWYKHHELFKKGRRSDPTAGHLGFRGVKGLRPAALPRHAASNVDLALDAFNGAQHPLTRRGTDIDTVPTRPARHPLHQNLAGGFFQGNQTTAHGGLVDANLRRRRRQAAGTHNGKKQAQIIPDKHAPTLNDSRMTASGGMRQGARLV
jgi:hypothetical protein